MTSAATPQAPPTSRQGVAFYDGSESFARLWPRLAERIERIVAAGTYSNGATVAELERAIERYTGARHAVGVGSGTDALVLLLRAAGIGPGDEVVVPVYTFIASATSVAQVGARPVFVDVEPGTYAIDPAAAEAAISDRTRAIMPVHLFTQMADMDALADVSRRTGVPLVEDSAEAIGMWWNGVHAGLLGRGGVLSFFPTKTLAALGDGGMVLTDDEELAERVRRLRAHGRDASGISQLCGTNSKMDEIQAAIVLARLEQLPQAIARRAAAARRYDEALAQLDGAVQTPSIVGREAATNAVYYVYLIEAERRDELALHLAERGIETEPYYPRPLHLQPCFADLGYGEGDFPVAERAAQRALGLPLHPDLAPDDIERVAAAIREFYGVRAP